MSLDKNVINSDALNKSLDSNEMVCDTIIESSQEEVLKISEKSNNQEIKSNYSVYDLFVNDEPEEVCTRQLNTNIVECSLKDNDSELSDSVCDIETSYFFDGNREIFSPQENSHKNLEQNKLPSTSSENNLLNKSTCKIAREDMSLIYGSTFFNNFETKKDDSSDEASLFDIKNDNDILFSIEENKYTPLPDEDINLNFSSQSSDSDSENEGRTVRYYSSFMHSFYDDTKSDSILNTETSLIEKEIKSSEDYETVLKKEPINTDVVYTKDTIKHVQDYLITEYEFARIKDIQKRSPLFEFYNPKNTDYFYCTINELLCLEPPLGFLPKVYLLGIYFKNENGEHMLYDKKFKTNIKLIFYRRETTPLLGKNILVYGILHFDKNYIGVKVHFWTLLCMSMVEKTHRRSYLNREKIKNKQIRKRIKCENSTFVALETF